MRVERPNQIQPINPYRQQEMKQDEAKAKGKGRDQLEISNEALELQRTQETTAERAERIAELKKKVQEGTYHVDTKDIAEALLKKGI
ncbi:flagellar biosynthesis anti-sigma factor FlgM [Aneurinibacillus aneurinilyticus]|jgi:negative regulator of flagellin synthesis FlgM|uniref:Negative regulator of flagellin synthesis n=1 Tax=Aneurinibacillus aneurinilyticus ATCC 12856 TaxID=649747 RepID=U1YFT8_ANEAE|nr:flagellar biosynthesis anti-sigma factor FlgM [Aneurinibacillus aneurinilyticus]ERI09661.1 flagellar biosynthesis anti-sigma factor FlgM [Aneurinibacillus aneurinilyticus ATCC 12856]MED0708250.1 flagellar biosynthesis anti-sigma factor FlgM [Aneurinibacillus aneurinilyticus]MED0724676.1 flagellar biosynthesis anti-sigma factor FlgM [Aneurinibacillus aneurinilyticus]MED0730569.1 flagellar biosynthesis anti-sigma factor FlgM [Aneurinibacillus aneurinilyticus]MED0743440.1 flagellar biosynthesi